jgi:plasmid stabilization system protein ParE
MRLIFLEIAVSDLASIRQYIGNNNPSTAHEVATRLEKIIKKLLLMPNLGRPGRVFGTRELVTRHLLGRRHIL